jgi:hypothetical protein
VSDSVTVYLADKWLAWLGGTAETAPSGLYLQLHTGDPGSAGTANVSSVTTREALTLGTPASGAVAANGTLPEWLNWAGTNGETDTDVSIWDASTGGNFVDSIQLSSPVTIDTGDNVQLASLSITFTTAS